MMYNYDPNANAWDAEWESRVIGGVLMDPSLFDESSLTAADFQNQTHAEMWTAIAARLKARRPVDVLTIAEDLERKTGMQGWLASCASAAQNAPARAAFPAYADRVRSASKAHHVRLIASELAQATSETWQQCADRTLQRLVALTRTEREWECGIREALGLAVERIDAAYQAGGTLGIPSGVGLVDERLGGLHGGDLIVIGARPAMGKTALMVNLALAAARAGHPVGIVSAEQPRDQVAARSIAMTGPVSAARMRQPTLMEDGDWARMTSAVAALADYPVRINDRPAQTIADVVRQARQWAYTPGVKAVYVDYLQRLRIEDAGKGLGKAPRHEVVGEIAQQLKELARELGIPVVALAQVNRAVEARNDKRPAMGDLSDSSGIEKEADVVMTLYRDEVYNPDTKDAGIAELLICKNRHGPTGMVRMGWDGSSMRFSDLRSE